MIFNYSRSLLASLGLHAALVALMLWQPDHSQAVLEADERSHIPQQMAKSEPAPIQAVAVDAQEVQEAMKKIERQRQIAKQQEINRQRELDRQAQQAKAAKAAEMKRVAELKKQADDLRVQQEKMKQEAQMHLKQLEQQKKEQEKQLLAMKQKKAAEAQKLEQIAKQRQEQVQKKAQELAAVKKAQELANQQRMAGEVDKYKALILNAIRDRWILPENVDPGLSSQFIIRLAPTGAVLDVRLSRSSGDSLLDRSAQAAIYKASPLPVPNDASAFNMFREISLTVRPSNARG